MRYGTRFERVRYGTLAQNQSLTTHDAKGRRKLFATPNSLSRISPSGLDASPQNGLAGIANRTRGSLFLTLF
jgi:hypothetical protein